MIMINCFMDSSLVIYIYQIINRRKPLLIQIIRIDVIEKTTPINCIMIIYIKFEKEIVKKSQMETRSMKSP